VKNKQFFNYNYLKTIYDIFIDMNSHEAVKAGGMRIRQRKKRQSTPIVHDTQSIYIDAVDKLNKKLLDMKDNDYLKFRDFSTKLVQKLGDELKRAYFKDRSEFKRFKGDGEDASQKLKYLFNTLFKPVDQLKILMRDDNTIFIKKTFTPSGINILTQMVYGLDKSLVEKKYDQVDPEKIYVKEQFKANCTLLGIHDNTSKVSFSLIKSQYDITKKEYEAVENIEKSLEVSNAFISLRNQYDNYLKSFN
jgi:hypothetical protein